jgi:hypothetical protein
MMKSIFGVLLLVGMVQADFLRDNSKEVVLDTTTQLMWQDDANASSVTKTWTEAITHCEALTLGGHSDWRLPNFNELYMLADRSTYNPAISSVFQNVDTSNYWSSTTSASDTSYAWVVDFGNGYDFAWVKSDTNYVRCVRGGQ